MAPKKTTLRPCPPIPVGDCQVTIESNNFTCESDSNGLRINVSRKATINILVRKDGKGDLTKNDMFLPGDEYSFVLINPKDSNFNSTSVLQEVLGLYKKELPAMRFAANTGKESMFMEKCVSSGKYCTLILKSKSVEGLEEVLAATTFQIVPAATQFAEIPIAAVSATHQRKGIGRLLFLELRNRLQSVGVHTLLCWGDKDSEGFWSKQGFVPIAEVDKKGRACRVPVRADIRRALCFPGGSTLMVSNLNEDVYMDPSASVKSHVNQCKLFSSFASVKIHGFGHAGVNISRLDMTNDGVESQPAMSVTDGSQTKENRIDDTLHGHGVGDPKKIDHETMLKGGSLKNVASRCQCSEPGKKRRIWEATSSSLKSKKVKGGHFPDCELHSVGNIVKDSVERDYFTAECSLSVEAISKSPVIDAGKFKCLGSIVALARSSKGPISSELQSKGSNFRIMLMNIADDTKKAHLTKVIESIGGLVTSEGSGSTHIVTGKVRRTLNFCIGLCSGAWIVSSAWLKESFREGRFVDEASFVVDDSDYTSKYGCDLKDAVLRARARLRALLEGYYVCIAPHVHPSLKTLTDIVVAAGGNIIRGTDIMKDPSKTFFIACEEDMEEALVALKKGVRTYGTEWLMSCIMRQELDLEAPQFAISL